MACEIGTGLSASMNFANLHVMMSISNCDYFEWWMPTEIQSFGVQSELVRNANGTLDAPTAPGLGLELDEKWIASHRVATIS